MAVVKEPKGGGCHPPPDSGDDAVLFATFQEVFATAGGAAKRHSMTQEKTPLSNILPEFATENTTYATFDTVAFTTNSKQCTNF